MNADPLVAKIALVLSLGCLAVGVILAFLDRNRGR